MADYLKATDFGAKDALLSGDPNKIVKGTEINAFYLLSFPSTETVYCLDMRQAMEDGSS